MRDGMNPASYSPQLKPYLRHRVILPVYIPTLDGYFKQAIEILRVCLESLHLTTEGRANITIVSNGSTREANAELEGFYHKGWVDQLLLNRRNRGRVDAVMSAARGSFEELITISDCDVLFRHGWLDAMEEIFRQFPECGIASPVPRPMAAWSNTSATILGGLARRELAFEKVVPDLDLDRFAISIGREDMFHDYRRAQMILRRGKTVVCVGSGHVIHTMRRDILGRLPRHACLLAYKGEKELIDSPPDRMGYWRLSTPRAFAYHMGNIFEPWMKDEIEECRATESTTEASTAALPALRRHWTARLPLPIRRKLTKLVKKSVPVVCRVRPSLRELQPGGI
ncbi:MAG: glycosyltransferase family 2 protein [Pyrinomonadaceae bacterium MAG19_C2-C3]|nr:glycosyltransferase family 2 protein [Pyrinomonadaceae bacterium MAG19_C2-C3]